MIGFFERLMRPFLQAIDPEDAHRLTIRMLKYAPPPPVAGEACLLLTGAEQP